MSAQETPQQGMDDQLRLLIDAAQDYAVFMLNRAGIVVSWNAGAERLYGYKSGEIIGEHFSCFYSDEEQRQGNPVKELEIAEVEGRYEGEARRIRRDGSTFWARVTITAIRDGTGALTGFGNVTRDLSERKLAEDALRASNDELERRVLRRTAELIRLNEELQVKETRFRTIIDAMSAVVWITDSKGENNRCIPAWHEYTGMKEEEARGWGWVRALHPDDRERAAAEFQESLSTLKPFVSEYRIRRADGQTRQFDVRGVPIKEVDGRVREWVGVCMDVTEREREIARMSRLYAALSQVNQAIVWSSTRDELLQRVCRVLVEQGGFRMAWIGWHVPETHVLVPVAEWGDENGYLQTIKVYTDDRPEGRGPSGTAFRSGRPFICNDVPNDPTIMLWRPELKRRGFRACAVFPIRMKGKVCGTLSVFANKPEFCSDKETLLLEEAAANVSFALDNFARDEARRQAERRVQNEKLFSDSMIESMPGVFYFYDETGRFLRWNRNFETVSGYSGEEIARMHPLDFFSGDEKARVERRIAAVLEKGEASVEASFVAKDGRVIPYYFTGRRIAFEDITCLLGVGIDISERKRAEDHLMESERKYRELVEQANSIILRWNSEGRITLLNEYGQRFFGYSSEEILGRHVIGTVVPCTDCDGRDLQRLIDEICADPVAFEQNVNENMRRNGEHVWIAWTNRIVRDAQSRVVEILSVGTDITERRKAETALRELNETLERKVAERTADLQTATTRAEAADRIKSAFLATMSHELRTPLNSIIGFTGIILQGLAGPLNHEQNKQLNMVRTSARHLLALVNDVLDISKIEAGQLEVAQELFDLRQSISKVVAIVTPLVEKKGLALRIQIAPDLGKAVSDERRFEQVLLNLLSNAIKFTIHGEVALTAELVTDFKSKEEPSGQSAVRLRISDTGIGIKPEDMVTLFKPFRQIDTGLARNHEGTGLGLAICRRLTNLMGGDITAESVWEKGSTFSVTIPQKRPVKT